VVVDDPDNIQCAVVFQLACCVVVDENSLRFAYISGRFDALEL